MYNLFGVIPNYLDKDEVKSRRDQDFKPNSSLKLQRGEENLMTATTSITTGPSCSKSIKL